MSIVIIGSSFAAIFAFECLVKQINAFPDSKKYSIKVISQSDKIYFTPAAPRMIVEPQLVADTFYDVEKNLAKRAKGVAYEFVHGTVEHADLDSKSVTVSTVDGNSVDISYDHLVIASGSRSKHPCFKLQGEAGETSDAIKGVSRTLEDVENIAVIGGGPTGVETASEIAYAYPKKNVTLFTGTSGPLSELDKSKAATSQLEALGVKIVNRIKCTGTKPLESGGYKLAFDNGTSEDYDFYIHAFGVIPNSSFIDKKYLNEKGFIEVDEYLNVKGHPEVVAWGDVASITEKTIVDIKFRQLKPFVQTTSKHFFLQNITLSPYTIGKRSISVTISRNGGVGWMYGITIPSFILRYTKCKDINVGKGKELFGV